MSQKTEIELQYGSRVFSIPYAAMERLTTASETEWRLLLLLAAEEKTRDSYDKKALAARLGVSAPEIDAAVAFWRGSGILRTKKADAAEKPAATRKTAKSKAASASEAASEPLILRADGTVHYDGKELDALLERRSELRSLLKECERIAEKPFSPAESGKLVALAESYRLSVPYIMTLFQHCRDRGQTAVPYVYRVAVSLYERNILDEEALTAYLAEDDALHSYEAPIRSMLGIGPRKFTAAEARFISAWKQANYPKELLEVAYERAVNATGKPGLAYMNKILTSWREKGIGTAEAAMAEDAQYREEQAKAEAARTAAPPLSAGKKRGRNAAKKPGLAFSSFDAAEFFDDAVKDTYAEFEGMSPEEIIRRAKEE